MADSLRHVALAAPSGWTALDDLPAAPATPSLARQGIRAAAEWSGAHEGDDSRLVIWSLRSQPEALHALVQSMQQTAHAERVDGTWMWAYHSPGTLSLSLLQPAEVVQGPPLLWATHLPLQTAAARIREIVDAMPHAAWRWNDTPPSSR